MHTPNHSSRRPSPPNALERWIEAERRGDDRAAENWLTTVCSGLPNLAPRPGFADRVLARAGLDRASRLERRRAWIVAVCLTTIIGTLVSVALWSNLAPAELVSDLGSGLTRATEWLALAVTLLARVVRLGELARTVAATPELTAGLLALVALAALAWTSLAFLLERSRHVEA